MKRGNGKLHIWKIFSVFSLVLFSTVINAQEKVENGILDLRNVQFRNKIFELNGDWEFYWDKHLRPVDFNKEGRPLPDVYGAVPSYWINYKDDIPGIEKTGYGTYRMTILLPKYIRTVIFDIPVFDSAFRLFIDGEYAGGDGLAGVSEAETKPEYEPYLFEYTDNDGSIEIIINVSNFHHRRGGFWLPMRVSTPEVMKASKERERSITGIISGILLAFVAFFLLFFLVFKREQSMLFFAMGTLGILLRGMSTGTYMISDIIDISWTNLIRTEYVGSFIAIIFAGWYFYKVFPDRYFKLINTVVTVLFSLSILLVLISPVTLFSNAIRIYIPTVAIILIYYVARSIISALNRESSGYINMIGFVALGIGVLNDIAISKSVYHIFNTYILPYCTTLFIFTQVLILITNWVRSFNEEKRLLSELEYVNKNLENIVIERTAELTNQKSEIEEQKINIEKKNEQLEKIILIRNRIFSIIAHDLKSPIASLSMTIERMRDRKKETDNYDDEIANQLKYTNNLIDNLLMWGQGQQKNIEFNPSDNNITDLVLETFNMLNPQAEEKQIKLSYSHRGSPNAWYDPDLLSIVLRNLVSNAIKFTGEKGKVSVNAEENTGISHHLKITVKDTGAGIDIKRLEEIRNKKIINSTRGTNGEKGTGLGLQLCYDLVEVNNGNLTIESTKGLGTSVIFTLPVKTKSSLV